MTLSIKVIRRLKMGYSCENARVYQVVLDKPSSVVLVPGSAEWDPGLVKALEQRVRVETVLDPGAATEIARKAQVDLVLLNGQCCDVFELYQEMLTATSGEVPLKVLQLLVGEEVRREDPLQRCPAESHFTSQSVEELTQQVCAELELARLKNEVRKARNDLDQYVQQQARFISLLAHDLRNPFHHLRMFPEFIRDSLEMAEPELVQQMAEEACAEVERVSTLLEEMLEYALLQMDRLEVNPQCMALEASIQAVLKDALPAAREKQVNITCTCSAEQYAVTDEKLVRTVLRNLVANAVKFTDQDDEVKVIVRDFGPKLRVDVQDSGVGLDMEKVPKIFDLGKKLQQSGTRQEKGHGYGLFLCDQLLARLNARIFVSGIPGEGALFFFYLPKCQGESKGHQHT